MKYFKRIISILLVFSMLMLCACSGDDEIADNDKKPAQIKYNTPAGTVKKSETVYVNLNADGKPVQTIVSDWLHTNQAQVYVNDVTNLSKIVNIKDDSMPDVNGQHLKWYLNTTDLYYQGQTNAPLPVGFNISYKLNGKPIKSSEIIGKSGHVEITVKMQNYDSEKVKVNGKEVVMYNPMLVVGGVALNESRFQNITVKNGKTVSNGNSQYAVLAGFPGINESLGLTELKNDDSKKTETDGYTFDDVYIISADAENFEIGNFMFSAIPIASLDIGLNDISTSMDDVRENLSKLQNIQEAMKDVDAQKLLDTLSSEPDKINNLTKLVSDAANLYTQNKALLALVDKYTTTKNIQAVQILTEYIQSANFEELEAALEVINSFFGDEADSEKIEAGMNVLKEMSDDLKDPEVKKAIDNLPQTIATLNELQKALDENKELIDMLQKLADSDVLTSVDSALSGIQGSLAANGISHITTITGDADEITARMTAWIEVGKKYTIFTKKASNMSSSVMFVFKVDSIKSTNNKQNKEEGK